jgi:hypothetical protein
MVRRDHWRRGSRRSSGGIGKSHQSCGFARGRLNLTSKALAEVTGHTLPIVGGRDHRTIELSQKTLSKLKGLASMRLISNTTFLFEEPDGLDKATMLAGVWLERLLDSTRL